MLSLGLSRTLGILYGNAAIAVSFTILIIDILLKEPIGIAMFIDAVVVGKAVDFFNWTHLVAPCKSLLAAIPNAVEREVYAARAADIARNIDLLAAARPLERRVR